MSSPGQRQSVLRFERVTVSFDEQKALDDVSFELRQRESLVVFGAAGSGKTTLLKTALGLLKPDSGRVFVFGRDITDLKEQDLFRIRSNIGMLFQEGGLFDSLTIEENVSYPLENLNGFHLTEEERRARSEEALRFVELEHTLDKFPSELSGGMRRRVGIARAIVTEPKLVLYDSPTAGLDPITAFTIVALIVKQRDLRGAATVMVTHRYQDAHFLATSRYRPETDQIETVSPTDNDVETTFLVLRDGRLVFQGTLAELEASRDPYVEKFVKREE
ncbi:MAG TPA: ATP-binding cassette domain-containing protein [Bryobacteraceae bacterium]|nr:ATP-binding cassette domain-containing protein [Bryobacteraceae bacterium]HPU71807.1 ATP-binding cassette domain-containing protein [Bryobacteraceae bacterium]